MRPRALLFVAGLLGPPACVAAPATVGPPASLSEPTLRDPIAWQGWTLEAFQRAGTEGKIVLLDVGIEGCTACRWMKERTYTHPEVIERLQRDFVTITVDAEARPDVGDRYAAWGWPALIFLTPQGEQLLAIKGNKVPENFITVLDELVRRRDAGTLRAEETASIDVPVSAQARSLLELRDLARAQLDQHFDPTHGGWGQRMRSPLAAPVEHTLLRHKLDPAAGHLDRALRAAAGYEALIDPVWGGVFVAAIDADGDQGWTRTIPEKRVRGQAEALKSFALAHRVTGDPRWIEAARAVDRYLRGRLGAPDGTFYTAQEDVAPGLPAHMSAGDYYAISGPERLQYGEPPVDHAVYTDHNAAVISAYVELYEATGDPRWLDVAVAAGRSLVHQRRRPGGWFAQSVGEGALESDQRMRPLDADPIPHLATQARVGLALTDLYGASGDPRWLERAEALAAVTRETLEDRRDGGFFDRPPGPMDSVLGRRKPLEANVGMARFLAALATYRHHDAELEALAVRTSNAVVNPASLRTRGRAAGELALALERLAAGGVEFTVVGDQKDPRAKALYDAALAYFEPRKALHWDLAGHYPTGAGAALFICSSQACSTPIRSPLEVGVKADRFTRPPP